LKAIRFKAQPQPTGLELDGSDFDAKDYISVEKLIVVQFLDFV
jgi:hypothetical protein